MRPQKQILVVEDNELNRAILCEILSDQYQVLEAENGEIALDILRAHKDSIALILLDVMMPVMDGYSFLDQMKQDPELTLIPVIVMTQSDSDEDEVSALAHGATDFVPKPYRPQVILHRIASIINLRETSAMVNQFQYDRLTGLYSKEFFYRKVKELLDENPGKDYTILCSNLENFKLYNDTFGRAKGDDLLKETADHLRTKLGSDAICCRYNADRFLILQERQQERLDRSLFFSAAHQSCHKKMLKVSIKWGIYEITDRSITVEQMCDRALLAVDSIKGQYYQPYAVYDDALRDKLKREKAITDMMETALTEKQFIVYYQPKYSLNGNCMAGAEALVRWIHPEWGFMSPGEFIPLFEKNGFISRLDQYVWEQVCEQLADWKKKGYPSLPISVNMSRSDVYQPQLVDTIRGITRRHGVEPSCLHLEVTESAYAENASQIIQTVDELRSQGFTIEMDDFGSGYSSLNMLTQMKLDILKLDMKFIQNELAKPVDRSILGQIIDLAHWMNLNVVAEGVESREQLERLSELGCDYVQGFYLAKPMPAAEYEALLAAQSAAALAHEAAVMHRHTMERVLLVVDDDARYRKTVIKAFADQYRVLEASNMAQALSCIEEYGSEAIATVILSMSLPENGAAALLEALRKNPGYWQIPILATLPCAEKANEFPLAFETDDFLCKCHPLRDLSRRVSRLIEISLLREREHSLMDAASQDYLTGLLNRRGLKTAMDALRSEDLPLAICMFDLDNLKIINDTYGHEMGDKVIQSFANLLRQQTRSGDIQCRYGGDEFVVVLRRLRNAADAERKVKRICKLFHELYAEEMVDAACSGGIAFCIEGEWPSIELIERADEALYQAKRENKGGCCISCGCTSHN